jgi:hypothetical protein
MGVVYCALSVYITNDTDSDLTFSGESKLTCGRYQDDGVPGGAAGSPSLVIPKRSSETLAFRVQSRSDQCMGTSGKVFYSLPDGAELAIDFDVPYNGQNTYVPAMIGRMAGSYEVSHAPSEYNNIGGTGSNGWEKSGICTVHSKKRLKSVITLKRK